MRFLVVVAALLLAAPATAQTTAAAAARDGWTAIRAGRHEQAARAFADAVRLAPKDPAAHFGAGLAAHLLGQPLRAIPELEETLRLAPEYTDASLLLGELQYRGGDPDTAMRTYEAALAHAPDNKAIAARLQQWRDEAGLHRDFFMSQSAHFSVLFEGPADEALARTAVDLLENAYWRVGSAFSTFPDQPTTVVLYTEQQFRDVTRSPEWAAAAYDGRIRVPVRGALRSVAELDRVLSHEFTHVVVRTLAPTAVPTWLNEGLAVAFEGDATAWIDTELSRTHKRLSPAQLSGRFDALSSADARLAYAESAAAVRTLIDRSGIAAVVALLQDITRGEPFDAAFEYRMLTRYDDFVTSLPHRDRTVLR